MTETVTLPREVVEQAINALYCTDSEEGSPAYNFELKAVKELRAALEQPKRKLTPQDISDSALLGNIESQFNACMHREHCKAWKEKAYIAPRFGRVAERKLDSLLSDGWAISGYSIMKHLPSSEVRHGFVTAGGLVGWWQHPNVPQPHRQPLMDEQIEKICSSFDDPMRCEMWKIGFKAAHNIK